MRFSGNAGDRAASERRRDLDRLALPGEVVGEEVVVDHLQRDARQIVKERMEAEAVEGLRFRQPLQGREEEGRERVADLRDFRRARRDGGLEGLGDLCVEEHHVVLFVDAVDLHAGLLRQKDEVGTRVELAVEHRSLPRRSWWIRRSGEGLIRGLPRAARAERYCSAARCPQVPASWNEFGL